MSNPDLLTCILTFFLPLECEWTGRPEGGMEGKVESTIKTEHEELRKRMLVFFFFFSMYYWYLLHWLAGAYRRLFMHTYNLCIYNSYIHTNQDVFCCWLI